MAGLMLMSTEAVVPFCLTFNNVGMLELKIVVLRVLSGPKSSGKSEWFRTSFAWLTVELVLLCLIFLVRNRRLPRILPCCAHAVALASSLAFCCSRECSSRVRNGLVLNRC